MQYFKQFRHNLTEQFFIEHVFIASDLQLIQDINELVFGQFEHRIEHFLHINFLHILQKWVQFLHIMFLHDEILHIIRQFEEHILKLQIEQDWLNLFILQIVHLFLLVNLILCFVQSFWFLKSFEQRTL